MPEANVHMGVWGDLDGVKRAVDSVPESFDIHVFDGRYVTFGSSDDPVLTPGLQEFVESHPQTIWYEPPEEKLPWGDPSIDPVLRSGVHEKAKWMYDSLPQNEWTLKLDDDEVLGLFSTERLDELDERRKYGVVVNMRAEGHLIHMSRLWKPKYWVPWIDDLPFPSMVVDEGEDLEYLKGLADEPEMRNLKYVETDIAYIENRGDERDGEYLKKRVEQLDKFERFRRARSVEEIYSSK